MLSAGRRDRQIIIQRSTLSETVIGAPDETWSTLYTLWADVEPVGGKEQLSSGREMSARLNRFRILYRAGITEKDKISYDGRAWDILTIRETGRREGLEITAESRA